MEKPEYQAKHVPEARFVQIQLNEMYDEGYEFVTCTINHMIYKKIKKHKKD